MTKQIINQDNLWRINVLEHALSQLGQGIILLSHEGKVLFMTDVAERMVNQHDGLDIVDNRLMAEAPTDNQRLQEMLHAVSVKNGIDNPYKNFYIHRHESHRPYLIQISRIELESCNECNVLMVIKDTHANTLHWIERLKNRYHLTKREADFVVLMTEGRSVKEISLVMEIAEDTVRQYLKNCFKKMEVQKQHELVCLALDCARKR